MNLRYSNRAIKWLFDTHQIDLMKLSGEDITDPERRVWITQAGMLHETDQTPEDIIGLCDELTPGEHIDLIQEAVRRDLMPASLREATAKAAPSPKSGEEG